jgi:hypothetical protein
VNILDNKSTVEVLDSLLGEIAKSSNEIKCAQQDINKMQNRVSFAIVLINELKQREAKSKTKGD